MVFLNKGLDKNKALASDSNYEPEYKGKLGQNSNNNKSSILRRAVGRLNRKQRQFKSKLNESLNRHLQLSWDDKEWAERQNCVSTLDLFRYALFSERLAICSGVLCMWYAASWQPISVFILAIMASLMGQYSKQVNQIMKLNSTILANESSPTTTTIATTTTNTTIINNSGDYITTNIIDANNQVDNVTAAAETNSSSGAWQQQLYSMDDDAMTTATSNLLVSQQQTMGPAAHGYDSYGFLYQLYSFVDPLFDWLMGSQSVEELTGGGGGSGFPLHTEHHEMMQLEAGGSGGEIKVALDNLVANESRQFLRKSFEINGSAFCLALTQLTAFFLGMYLISWSAKAQASRVKVLYFRSSLQQEVTWFEAIDSASGSGSSLNALVDKFEDGIGTKLALLCYFLGHVGLFALTAFFQMPSLASFCMPFVFAVGLIILYLSDWQAVAIGQHALFAKRSLQLAEEILAAIRTVFAYNGQQKELARFGTSLQPVYRKSLIKHLYTALNTSLSKFSIFACFACYCFYAMRLFPPFRSPLQWPQLDKSTILAVMRGAEVSIVNILISIPFMEALQQSKGSIARIFAAIERRSRIDPLDEGRGFKPQTGKWLPSLSFRLVQFSYADRSGPTGRRRSTLPFLNLAGSPGSGTRAQFLGALEPPTRKSEDPTESQAPADPLDPASSAGRRLSLVEGLAEDLLEARRVQRATHLAPPPSPLAGGRLPVAGRSPTGKKPGTNQRILSDFNLEIRAGQSVALVGPSGSGKSTVLSLVQRLYDIGSGQLLVGQHNIKDLSVSWLRRQIGVVSQEPRLFDLSIEDNIRLGLNDDDDERDAGSCSDAPTEEGELRARQQVVEAAREAGAHEFISQLPEGYATRVGSGGVQLSGGQKQRIAIARALIRKPKILLLDEPTSALDTESEAQVQEALKRASAGRTTLMVAHRLATVKSADLIVVMAQGRVLECGTHDELMEGDGAEEFGLYRQMYLEQAAAVRATPPASPQGKKSPASGSRLPLPQVPLGGGFGKEPPAGSGGPVEDSGRATGDEQEAEENRMREELGELLRPRPSAMSLWRFLEMPKWSSLGAVVVCLMAGLILPMNLIAHSYLFSAFAYAEPDQIGGHLRVFGLLILSFSSLVFIISFLQVLLPGYVGEKISVRLRVKSMQSLLNKPMFYFDMDTNSAGSLCDRLNNYIADIQSLAGARLSVMLEACSTLAAGAIYGFGQNLALSSFCLCFALLVLLTTIIESRIVQSESEAQQEHDAQLAHLMADALSNIKTIASLNREQFFIDKFTKIIERRQVGVGRPMFMLRIFLMSLKFVMPAMSWSASIYYGCHLLVDGRIDLQTVFIVCPVVLFAVNDTFRALVFLPELLKARKSIERLYLMNREFSPQVLQTQTLAQQLERQTPLRGARNLPATRISGSGHLHSAAGNLGAALADRKLALGKTGAWSAAAEAPAGLPDYMGRRGSRLGALWPEEDCAGTLEPSIGARGVAGGRGLKFSDVQFAYPQRPSAQVLRGLSLEVAPGETCALVGGSGSGKSTCAAILEKFYDFQAGSVAIDAHDLRLLDSRWVRSQIGLVMQEPTLLSYTIGDNIRYGDNGRLVPMDEVVSAAREANIHEFICSLPDGYDTELAASAYSGGCQLSGGQRQRLAIARALVSRAPILIFDEATSALDARNETLVQEALDRARRGRTTLVIAHRLASIREADKIAVLREGRVVELGRHEELLRINNGFYASLWRRQEGAAQQADGQRGTGSGGSELRAA